ncbi:unannotated protein [freshwater metagenome]|uniref:Unannotated protein n=1 Tax=freshwater metagenome TaxID=449393 RepID=A0A6J7I6E4_9ZZZZ
MSAGRTPSRSRPATCRSSSSPAGWPRVSLTVKKPSRSRESTAGSRPVRPVRVSAWATRSSNRDRLASPVSPSWKAWWASSSCTRCRSLTSCIVTTRPWTSGWAVRSTARTSTQPPSVELGSSATQTRPGWAAARSSRSWRPAGSASPTASQTAERGCSPGSGRPAASTTTSASAESAARAAARRARSSSTRRSCACWRASRVARPNASPTTTAVTSTPAAGSMSVPRANAQTSTAPGSTRGNSASPIWAPLTGSSRTAGGAAAVDRPARAAHEDAARASEPIVQPVSKTAEELAATR